jgi:hypothetical protein
VDALLAGQLDWRGVAQQDTVPRVHTATKFIPFIMIQVYDNKIDVSIYYGLYVSLIEVYDNTTYTPIIYDLHVSLIEVYDKRT